MTNSHGDLFAFHNEARAFIADQNRHFAELNQPAPQQWCQSVVPTGQVDLVRLEIDLTKSCIEALEQAINRERRKARIRHWSYDFNRHMGLRQKLEQYRKKLELLLHPHTGNRSVAEPHRANPLAPVVTTKANRPRSAPETSS